MGGGQGGCGPGKTESPTFTVAWSGDNGASTRVGVTGWGHGKGSELGPRTWDLALCSRHPPVDTVIMVFG